MIAKTTGRFIPILIILFVVIVFSKSNAQPNPGFTSKNTNFNLSTDSLLLGQSSFFDQDLSLDSTVSCNSCHYNKMIDTVNWNPSLLDLALKWRKKSLLDFEDVFYLPMTNKLFESHENFELNGEQIRLIKYYLDHSDVKTLMVSERKFNFKLFFFIAGMVLFLFVLIDLVFFRLIKYKVVHLILLLLSLIFCSYLVYHEMVKLGLQKSYEPDQPIKFSHKIHSDQNGIDCYFCHMPAKRGKSAGIPGVNVCLNCHAAVVEGEKSGGFEISKLLEYKQAKKPIPWIRVNNLPDHVFFNHSSHVNGGIDCTECHIGIEEMDRTRQEQELSMSWCLDCHLEKKINIENNEYYADYRSYLERNKLPVDSATVYQLGGWDCMNCHY